MMAALHSIRPKKRLLLLAELTEKEFNFVEANERHRLNL